VLGFRNGVQDLAVALFIGNIKDPKAREELLASPQMMAFRRQAYHMGQYAVTEICKEMRQLNATAPCSKCDVTGILVGLGGERTVCPACKGTGWEPLL